MTKWKITNDTVIAKFLQTKRLIHPVKFNGKVLTFGGAPPRVYCWAGFESMEVKYDKSACNLVLKIKTFEAGTGSPEFVPNLVAYADGLVDTLSSDW